MGCFSMRFENSTQVLANAHKSTTKACSAIQPQTATPSSQLAMPLLRFPGLLWLHVLPCIIACLYLGLKTKLLLLEGIEGVFGIVRFGQAGFVFGSCLPRAGVTIVQGSKVVLLSVLESNCLVLCRSCQSTPDLVARSSSKARYAAMMFMSCKSNA